MNDKINAQQYDMGPVASGFRVLVTGVVAIGVCVAAIHFFGVVLGSALAVAGAWAVFLEVRGGP